MSENQTKVGMIGAGFILESHATAVATVSSASLHMVCDIALSRAEAAAQKFGFAHAVSSVQEVAASDCDVVHILLPPALHLDVARTLVEAGKSVFLEKPMGLDSAECAALCDLADEHGVVVGVNHNFLFCPAYERVRNAVKGGDLGRIDQLQVNWHYDLPILQFGPFDNWMVAAPANLLFELSPHGMAFIVDLMDDVDIEIARVAKEKTLPGKQKVFRHWLVAGRSSSGSAVTLSLSMMPGQADRILRVRGRGGSAQVDFGRDFGWIESTQSDNPLFDAHTVADGIARDVGRHARSDRRRRILATLRKRPNGNPFAESIFRSITAFYSRDKGSIDPRHDGRKGSQVIALCERAAELAGVGAPSLRAAEPELPRPLKQPTVLVVGGSGFIGRRLVQRLVDEGLGVRVLTRNLRSAALDLDGLAVELVSGSHGNPDVMRPALDGIETVYHLAKAVGKRWQDYVDNDITPTRSLAEVAIEKGVKRFIYTGTIDSHASSRSRSRIDSTTPVDRRVGTRNLYARSKAACEALLQELSETKGLPLVITRPAIVIGIGSPPAHMGVGRFVSDARVDYWGAGDTKLPLVLVDDVAEALFLAHGAEGIDGETFILTSEPLLSARDYVEAVEAHSGIRIDARPRSAWRYWLVDVVKEGLKHVIRHPNRRFPSLHDWRCRSHRAYYDNAHARELLGWKPVDQRNVMIERGINQAVDHFMA